MRSYFIATHYPAKNYDPFAAMLTLHSTAYKIWIYISEGMEENTQFSAAEAARTVNCSRASAYNALEELIRAGYLRPIKPDVYDFYEALE